MGFSLDAFRNVASGNYNLGSVVIGESGSEKTLTKVNYHKWRVLANFKSVSAEQNEKVRQAFYASVCDSLHGELGVGKGAEFLEQIRRELLDKGVLGKNLSRDTVHDIIQRFDELLRKTKNSNVQLNERVVRFLGQGNETSSIMANAKTYARETGLPVGAIQRLCQNEMESIKFLMHGWITQEGVPPDAPLQAFAVRALKQLAGLTQLKKSDVSSADDNVRHAFDMLKGGFPQKLIEEHKDCAYNLLKGLNALLASDKGTSVPCDQFGINGLTLNKRQDGTLSITFGEKTETLPISVTRYARQLEKVFLKADERTVDRLKSNQVLDSLASRWEGSFDGNNVNVKPSYGMVQHCREVAINALVSRFAGDGSVITPKLLSKFSTVALMAYVSRMIGRNPPANLGQVANQGQGVPTAAEISGAAGDIKPSFQSVEAEELLEYCPESAGVRDSISSDDEALDLLSEFACRSQLQDGKFKDFVQQNIRKLVAAHGWNFDPGTNLSPMVRIVLDRMHDVMGEGKSDAELVDGLTSAAFLQNLNNKKVVEINNQLVTINGLQDQFESDIDNLTGKLNLRLGAAGLIKDNPDKITQGDVDIMLGKSLCNNPAYSDYHRPNVDLVKQIRMSDFKTAAGQGKLESYSFLTARDATNEEAFENCAHSYFRPEKYSCTYSETENRYVFGSKPLVKSDTFDLLAATITSPKTIRGWFPKNQKPSEEGALDIVHTMLDKFQALTAKENPPIYLPPDEKDASTEGRYNKSVEFLVKVLGQPPASLQATAVRSALDYHQISNGKYGTFDDFLRQLPTPAVSAVLKALCQHSFAFAAQCAADARTVLGEDAGEYEDNPGRLVEDVAKDYINPVYEKMASWRNAVGDVKAAEKNAKQTFAELFGSPKNEGDEIPFDQLDSQRAEQLRWARSKSSGGESLFVKKLLVKYLKNAPSHVKAKIIAALTRHAPGDAVGDDGINWSLFRVAMKGCGPILQKYLQKFPLPADASQEMRDAFNDLRKNLNTLPMSYVNAQLRHIRESSEGRITGIEFKEFVGQATIGVVAKCLVRTIDNPAGEYCAVKFLRPDVGVRMEEEKKHIDDIVEGMKEEGEQGVVTAEKIRDATNSRFDSIEKELDFERERDGVEQGKAYQGKSPDVTSVSTLSYVVPDKSFVIMKYVEGGTMDDDLRSPDVLVTGFKDKVKAVVGDIENVHGIENISVGPGSNVSRASDLMENIIRLFEARKRLIKSRAQLVSAVKVWFNEALKGGGFYHGDLHAGNIKGGKDLATLIDFGNFNRLPPNQRKAIAKMYSAVWSGKSGVKKFIQGFKDLKNAEEGKPLSNEDANKLKTLEGDLQKIFAEGRTPEEILARLRKSLELLSEKGIKASGQLNDFISAQDCLVSTLRDMNNSLKRIDQALYSVNQDGKWILDQWPPSNGKTFLKPLNDFVGNVLGAKFFNFIKGADLSVQYNSAELTAVRSAFKDQCDKLKTLIAGYDQIKDQSYESVIGEIVKGKSFA